MNAVFDVKSLRFDVDGLSGAAANSAHLRPALSWHVDGTSGRPVARWIVPSMSDHLLPKAPAGVTGRACLRTRPATSRRGVRTPDAG